MAQIKITVGSVAIEYDGEQNFIEGGLLKMVDAIISKAGSQIQSAPTEQKQSPSATPKIEMSTNTIAQMIGVKTGSELALAAIVRINIVKANATAGRSEILDEMREASSYFKETYVSNLSAYLETLVKSRRVNLVSRATYALAAAERRRLEGLLAGAADVDG